MLEFSHSNFLHAQIERSVQHVLGLEACDLIQTTTAEAKVRPEADESISPLLANVSQE